MSHQKRQAITPLSYTHVFPPITCVTAPIETVHVSTSDSRAGTDRPDHQVVTSENVTARLFRITPYHILIYLFFSLL